MIQSETCEHCILVINHDSNWMIYWFNLDALWCFFTCDCGASTYGIIYRGVLESLIKRHFPTPSVNSEWLLDEEGSNLSQNNRKRKRGTCSNYCFQLSSQSLLVQYENVYGNDVHVHVLLFSALFVYAACHCACSGVHVLIIPKVAKVLIKNN